MNHTDTTKRDDILFAASRILHTQSISHLTLEAVAKEAGLSKGGLLYHFPSKDAIIQGLIEKGIEYYTEQINMQIDKDPEPAGSWSRAYLYSSFYEPKDISELWVSGFLSALAFNRDFLHPLDKCFQLWQNNTENDKIDSIDATIIKLVADGIWFLELFGFTHLTSEMKTQVYERLLGYSAKKAPPAEVPKATAEMEGAAEIE